MWSAWSASQPRSPPTDGVGRRDCGRCHGLGTATQSQRTSGIWPAKWSLKGQLRNLMTMSNLSGPIFPLFQMWSKEAPKCSRCKIMKRYHRTFWTPSCRICSRHRVHHVHCRGLWVAGGWCWSHSRPDARHDLCTKKCPRLRRMQLFQVHFGHTTTRVHQRCQFHLVQIPVCGRRERV